MAHNSIFGLGLIGAGTNNARLAATLRQLAQYHAKVGDLNRRRSCYYSLYCTTSLLTRIWVLKVLKKKIIIKLPEKVVHLLED